MTESTSTPIRSGSRRLAGQVALVTGASRGMGKSIAIAFADEGAAVAVVARSESVWNDKLPGTIHETVAEITSRGGRAIAVAADLGNLAEVESAYERAVDQLGSIDILVNNAALTVPGRPPRADDARSDDGRPAERAAPRGRSRTAATRRCFITSHSVSRRRCSPTASP